METPMKCAICGCATHDGPGYAQPTKEGRSHATKHHYVAERFYGRSANRKGSQRAKIFEKEPWHIEPKTGNFCYDCHEELLHNPILLPQDIKDFYKLVKKRNLDESQKTKDRDKLAGRILLLHEVIAKGIETLLKD